MVARNRNPPSVLIVEGKDDSAVVQSTCRQHDLPEDTFHVAVTGGLTHLWDGVPLEIRRKGMRRLGVLIDADGDPEGRWAALRNLLFSQGYGDTPAHPSSGGTIVSGGTGMPLIGIWMMPDNGSPGMLEDFAACLIPADDPLWIRAGEAVDAIPEDERRFSPAHRSKAHIHNWLAWQEYPGSPMGQAITKGDLDANAPAAQAFVAWLTRLFVDEPAA